jgi:N-acetylglucosaminyl-diphospho-decaprenol L-rhamnosyltransferase
LDPSAERPTIGLVVLARDEEETIGRCLSSVPWDQAVVVDMASADATANVAGALGAAVVSVPPMRRFDIARQRGLDVLQTDWVIQLDADETAIGVVETLLAEGWLKSGRPLAFPRMNYLGRRWVRRNRWWPDHQVRMFRRGQGYYIDTFHAALLTSGDVLKLPATAVYAIRHFGHKDAGDLVRSSARYIPPVGQALSLRQSLRICGRPVGAFMASRGWRDGTDGLVILLSRVMNALGEYSSRLDAAPDRWSAGDSIGVIIVNYNGGEHLRRCAESLVQQLQAGDCAFIVDNASTDGSLEGIPTDDRVRVIRRATNSGFALAANEGAALCATDSLFFLNSDCILGPETLSELRRAFHDLPATAAGVAPKLLNADGSLQHSVWMLPTPASAVLEHAAGLQSARYRRIQSWSKPKQVEAASGAALLVRREAFDQVDGFDSTFFMYVEDIALCRKLSAHGGIWYLPQTELVHIGGGSSDGMSLRRILIQNRLLDYERHFPPAAFQAVRLAVAGGESLRSARRQVARLAAYLVAGKRPRRAAT